MKRLFNKKKNNTIMVTAWHKLFLAINHKAHKCADYLNAKASKWSTRKIKIVAVFLGVLWIVGSAIVIWRAIENKQKALSVANVSVPRYIAQPAAPFFDTAVNHAVLRIEHFKHWLDSLHQQGSPIYDSITKARPGLLDSILFIQQYYSSKK